MAKGQKRSNREAKKPKQPVSAAKSKMATGTTFAPVAETAHARFKAKRK